MVAAELEGIDIGDYVLEGAVALVILVHLALLLLAPKGLSLPRLIAVEATLLAVLVGVEWYTGSSLPTASAIVFPFALLLGLTWVLVSTGQSITVTALVLVGTVALLAYGMHRYELVMLGLVEDYE